MARNYPPCDWTVNSSYHMNSSQVFVVDQECAVNNESCSKCVFHWMTDAYVYVMITCYSIIMTLGILGNLTVIIVILTVRELKIVINLLLVALAFSDLIITIALPFTFLHNISYQYEGKTWVCRVVPLIQGTAVMSGIYTLVAIACERFYVIVYPFKSRILNSSSRVILCVVTIWFASACMQIPQAIVVDIVIENGTYSTPDLEEVDECESVCVQVSRRTCRETWNSDSALAYSYAVLVIMYIIPLTCITALYFKIGRAMWKRRPVGSASENEIKLYRQKVRLITFLVVLVVIFTVLWGPYFIIHCIPDSDLSSYAYSFIQMMGHANVAVDPILYAYFHRKVRSHAFGYLRRASALFRSDSEGLNRVNLNRNAVSSIEEKVEKPNGTNQRAESSLSNDKIESTEPSSSGSKNSVSYDDLMTRIIDIRQQNLLKRGDIEMSSISVCYRESSTLSEEISTRRESSEQETTSLHNR